MTSNSAEATALAPTSRPDLSTTTRSHALVASFLASQGYTDTLAAFKRECSDQYEVDGEDEPKEELDLREVVEEFLTTRMKSVAIAPAPLEDKLDTMVVKMALPDRISRTIRLPTNVLSVSPGSLPARNWDPTVGLFKSTFTPCVFVSDVERTVKLFSTSTFDLLDSYSFPSPVLSIAIDPTRNSRFIVAATMEGSMHLIDLVSHNVVQKLFDFHKFIVKIIWSPNGRWVAAVAYDKQVIIYEVVETAAEQMENALLDGEEADELATTPKIELVQRLIRPVRTNPESAVFLPDSSFLVYSAREDHLLHYVRLPGPSPCDDDWALSTINLNENGDAWVSFSILHMTVHPILPILSLHTSTENSRIILLPFHSDRRLSTLFTTASQGEFTTPRHAWLPDGSALVCNSEDGVLRILDLQGKVRGRIGAHGAAAPVEEEGEVEGRSERARARRESERGSSVVKDVAVLEVEGKLVFVSVGFDKTVRVSEN